MSYQWHRLGRVFCPDGNSDWMDSYAQVPRVLPHATRLEILFATRSPQGVDGQFISRIGSVTVDRNNPTSVRSVSSQPVLDVGETGAFDEFGVMPGCVIRRGDEDWLYYTGWSRPADAPYQTTIGLARRRGDGHFFRHGSAPVLGVTPDEPILCNGPFIIEADDRLQMFYASALRWIDHQGRKECEYRIACATSVDGIHWDRDGRFIVPVQLTNECQNAPTVAFIAGRYHMWFCYREAVDFRNSGRGYRLAYAWSDDLQTWHRDSGSVSLTGADGEWEREMQCYPGVCNIDDRWLMFYCGNYFGQSGFGCAELQHHFGPQANGRNAGNE